jgi:hypothetical protein
VKVVFEQLGRELRGAEAIEPGAALGRHAAGLGGGHHAPFNPGQRSKIPDTSHLTQLRENTGESEGISQMAVSRRSTTRRTILVATNICTIAHAGVAVGLPRILLIFRAARI